MLLSARAPRDEDELEGALLPVATQIPEETCNTLNPAVPIADFDYETAITVEQQQQQENVAFTIPQNERAAVADDSRSRIKFAESKGLIASEAEKEAIRNGTRNVFSKDYFSKQAIQAANHNAKLRNSQGLQVSDKPPTSLPGEPDSRKENATQLERSSNSGNSGYKVGGGYEVKEYSFGTNYETSDYEVREYRSVYD